jgi:hypothetical protein
MDTFHAFVFYLSSVLLCCLSGVAALFLTLVPVRCSAPAFLPSPFPFPLLHPSPTGFCIFAAILSVTCHLPLFLKRDPDTSILYIPRPLYPYIRIYYYAS